MSFPSVPLSEIARPITRPIPVLPGVSYRTIGVKWWGEGAYERETIDGSQTAAKTLTLVREGDLIINKIWVRHGSTAIASKSVDGCAASGEFPTFELDCTKVLPKWIHWLTKSRSFWDKCDALSRGTSGKNRIRPDLFLTIQVPLPHLSEQHLIVARIEELSTRIEEARGLRREAVEDAKALIENVTHSLFDELEKHNAKRLLKSSARILGGGTPSKANIAYWQGKIPWVSPKDMKVRNLYDTEDHISELALQSGVATLIPRNSVLVVVRSGILRRKLPVSINRVPVAINQDMKALIPDDDILFDFLAWWLKGKEAVILKHVKGGTTVQSVVWDIVHELSICIPPLSEQHHIVDYLDKLQSKVDSLKQLQAETSADIEAMLPSVLDKAFKGEL